MSVSSDLWAADADLVAAALAHPFVQGIADGTLPRERFAGYVAQDAFFLDAFARAYRLGAESSGDDGLRAVFTDLRAGVQEELRLHTGYAQQWGIDLADVQPLPATTAYTGFLLDAAGRGDAALTCAAMTPCMRLYAHLGQQLAGRAAGPYREWVDTYAAPEFEELAARLERLLDQLCADTSDQRLAAVRSAYSRAMQLEVGFFDAAWAGA
ncbi:TenA family protein [Modestobacter roseus]|uniref:Thiaminase/transcriptional activator TenA n=1 Tax=Modestobacter roseus TaxID=1181884 RepID=A0A562IVR1_9ACTN|nr:TenA family protein [Modestobacter roseus]MQA36140.1 TenA family protein [Modestobacter roseus]TWH75048.1 thiaminase/transcriptional activator TenA [Modestobacter roseus]